MRKRLGATVALAVGVLVLFATPALAHVTIEPPEATVGSFRTLVFSAPNESTANANMVKFEVRFDVNHPIPLASVLPKTGWTPVVSKADIGTSLETEHGAVQDVVSSIVWSGGSVPPGQFEEFSVLVGPLPAGVDVLLFPAVQTYSDGTEVRWDQQTFEERSKPANPAPVLTLTPPGGKQPTTKSSSGTSLLAVAALLIGGAGLGFGFYTWSVIRRWR